MALLVAITAADTSAQAVVDGTGAKEYLAADQRGTAQSPLVIKTTKTEEETAQETRDRQEKAANDGKLVQFTRQLVLATFLLGLIAMFQFFAFAYQGYKLDQTVNRMRAQEKVAGDSVDEMRRAADASRESVHAMKEIATAVGTSAAAAAKSVDAMEGVKTRVEAQMRAYLTVTVGSATYQERENNLRFDAKPILQNTGSTPAHKTRFVASAAILPVPLPADFDFPLPELPTEGGLVLGPGQASNLFAIVPEVVEDDRVNGIKSGLADGLYVWGTVTYEDVFGQSHRTRFCQHIIWLSNGGIYGFYNSLHNDSD